MSNDDITLHWTSSDYGELVAEVDRLTRELADLRLVLAAEQGRQEGAPSSGWRCSNGYWLKGAAFALAGRNPDGSAYWVAAGLFGDAPNMRAAMQAADEAEAAAAKEPTP